MTKDVYIVSMGAFLPGPAIPNSEMASYLGLVGSSSRLLERVLEQNKIRARHYAIDKQQQSLYSNSEMAARSIQAALAQSHFTLSELELLSVGTSQGDYLLPGFASMVHGELEDAPSLEVASLHGVCASGIMALKHAWLQLKSGEKKTAVACASEFPSRLFKKSRYCEQDQVVKRRRLPFDTEFLRWMLSDGAGAAILHDQPRPNGQSLRIDWIKARSFADRFDVCMFAGANKNRQGEVGKTWLDYPSFQAAAADGALNLKQDTRMLDDLVKVGVDYLFELMEEGLDTREIDHFVGHYSSHIFREKILDLLERSGVDLPERKWFTNLYTKGNTGSASIYILLEELFNGGTLKAGQKILCMVPESGRFTVSYMLLTVVGDASEEKTVMESASVQGLELNLDSSDTLRQGLVRRLARVWIDFELGLRRVPLIEKIERNRLRHEDYKLLLLNMRQQVVEGARWIARAASNIDDPALRSLFIRHAGDEHRDFEMLEQNYISLGGKLAEIRGGTKNIGSEALSAWMFHRASQANPFDLLGAMFIIEGLGTRVARRWGERILKQLELDSNAVSFLLYHGENDESHFERLEAALGGDFLNPERVHAIVKTAKVTARLYRLQLEEIGQC